MGSNIDPRDSMLRAIEMLTVADRVLLTGISTIYRTPALPHPNPSNLAAHQSDPDFLNGVLEIRTEMARSELEELLGQIEDALGRIRTEDRYAPRTMDLDVLLHLPEGGHPSSLEPEGFSGGTPHPDVLTRAWVALPLFELAPDLTLPPESTPLAEIAASFDGPGGLPETGFTTELRTRFLSGPTL